MMRLTVMCRVSPGLDPTYAPSTLALSPRQPHLDRGNEV
jgi:hypothetical protein